MIITANIPDMTTSVTAILPYLQGLYPDTPIGMVHTDKLLELTIEGKTDNDMNIILIDLQLKFPLAF